MFKWTSSITRPYSSACASYVINYKYKYCEVNVTLVGIHIEISHTK